MGSLVQLLGQFCGAAAVNYQKSKFE